MEISVSDVLTFSKCPYLWWKGHVQKLVPKPTDAMSFGTKLHSTVATVMRGLMTPPACEPIDAEDYKTIIKDTNWSMKGFKVVAVEKPEYFTYGGHTFLYRPDGILQDPWDNYCSYQIKTVSANRQSTLDYVKYSVHESIYGYGIHLKYNTVYTPRIILDRFVKSKTDKPLKLHRDTLVPLNVIRHRHLNYCVFIADRMEEMLNVTTQGEEADEEAAKLWSNRGSCIDWITGVKCPAFRICYGYTSTADCDFEPASDRYADLDRSQPPAQG